MHGPLHSLETTSPTIQTLLEEGETPLQYTMQSALNIIYEKLDPWIMEEPQKTKDQIFAEMLQELRVKRAFLLERNSLVFYLMPETNWRARIHVFSAVSSRKVGIQTAKELTYYLFCNINSLQKLYGFTPHKKFLPTISKFGWKHEGVLTSSHLLKTGELVDQYIFGITRSECEEMNKNIGENT